jgi:hypothetical protein
MSPVRTVLGAVVVAVPLALAAPAHAADPLTATIGFCEAGNSQYICHGSVSGGIAPIITHWSPAASGRCTPNRYLTVTLTATDASGAVATGSTRVWCTTNQWP